VLLRGVSVSALVVAAAATPPGAAAAPFRSLNQSIALSSKAAQAATSNATAVTAGQQAALGAQNVAAAATRFRSLAETLAGAATTTTSNPIVVDGYGPGAGLQTAPGTTAGSTSWSGASLPVQTTTAKGITVTVTQTQQLAQLTWQKFNVGAKTTLNFNQSAGGTLASSWVVINTVLDPEANGSQILGAINAQGKVYVLNRNGIAFYAGSTINVGSLIAATADIAQSQFSTTASGLTTFNLYGAQTPVVDPITGQTSNYQATFINGSDAAITVAPGAVIQTAAPTGTNGGGYVFLLGGNVSNAGVISTPQGQTVLAAGTGLPATSSFGGTGFILRQGFTGSVTAGNITSTTLGSEIATTNYASNYTTATVGQTKYITPATNATYSSGSVTNSGIIVSDQGDISLVGHDLTQSGILLSTTTVDQRGTIHFLTPTNGTDLTASITLAPGSVTEILPEDNGETALDSQRATNIADSAIINTDRLSLLGTQTLNNTNTLADTLGESRVEISTGGSVDVGNGASVVAQGGQIAIGGGSSVLLENGSVLDVSGTTNTKLAASVNALNITPTSANNTLSVSVNDLFANIEPFQLRDSAANRTGVLKGTNVYVDELDLVEIASGAYAGNIYTPGGLLEVGGYLGLIPHGIGEWTAIGGQVTLQAAQLQLATPKSVQTTLAGTVTTDPNAVINLQGGTVTYEGGQVPQTYVQSADGRVFNINNAPGNLVYVAFSQGFQTTYSRWKTTFDYVNPLLTPPTIYEPSYVVGRDAGSITINAGAANIQGPIYAGVTIGQYQSGPRPANVTDPYLLAQSVVPQAGSLLLGNYETGQLQLTPLSENVVFQGAQPAGAGSELNVNAINAAGAVSSSGSTVTPASAPSALFSAASLDADGLANIIVSTAGSITVAGPLSVANGGTVSLVGSAISVQSSITARGGAITLTDQYAPTGKSVGGKPSITLASGASLDTHGLWTNTRLDPAHPAGLAYVNAGNVVVQSSGGVTLSAGSTINVSSGGGFLDTGASLSGKGGNLAITADTTVGQSPNIIGTSPVFLDATILGYASGGGGTLALTAPYVQFGGTGTAPNNAITLSSANLSTGFSSYVINGVTGLQVLPGTQITAVQPIYVLNQGIALPTGTDPSKAYSVILPDAYVQTKGTDILTERAGASIALLSTDGSGQGGPVTIGAGSDVSVDPGQSITVAGFGQVSVFGSLTAHSGTIQVANTNSVADQPTPGQTYYNTTSTFVPGQSVWLGSQSVLDASGQAILRTDQAGLVFGVVGSGGTILLGGYAGQPTLAQVIERPGAVVDANGASASVDVVAGATPGTVVPVASPVTLQGSGGTVAADSSTGIALDGTVTARAGGASAAGGTLALTLDAVNFSLFNNIPTYVFQPRDLIVTTQSVAVDPSTSLQAGQVPAADTFGLVRASQQQIDAGGFDTVSLSALGGAIIFDGSVSLHTARAITLTSGIIGGSSASGSVTIAAPYVNLVGETTSFDQNNAGSAIQPTMASTAVLNVSADLIDLSQQLYLGGSDIIAAPVLPGTSLPAGFGPPATLPLTTAFGFGQANFNSTGDIRFTGTSDPLTSPQLLSIGNITFTAAQLYPGSGQSASVIAGYDPTNAGVNPIVNGGTITIRGLGGAAPQAPYSVGGTLTFVSDNIVQDGVVRAPEGALVFTDGSNQTGTVHPSQVTFAPNSITSVSLYGQTIPYGGTADGVTYTAPGGGAPALFQPVVSLTTQSVDVQAGATIDLRGGGTLSGAGFVFGRGGTADVLTTPLLDINGAQAIANANAEVAAVKPLRSGDAVYAILPGYASSYAPAPAPGDSAYTATQIGEQVTVTAGQVPGLAAGTYTLLPAYYALLPGAYRVELTSNQLPAGTTLPQGNFTTAAAVSLSVANTTIASVVPGEALFTSGTDVRQLSQYDEETYNAFEAASATQFGGPRPLLPQDAKTFSIFYPNVAGNGDPLSIAPGTLLDAPGSFGASAAPQTGYGATVEISTLLGISVYKAGTTPPAQGIALADSTLDGLDAPRLVLGGTVQISSDTVNINGAAAAVTIEPGAVLTAGDVLLTALPSGQITIAGATKTTPGGTISTIGAGPAAYDSTDGFLFSNPGDLTSASGGPTASPVVDVSNGQLVFIPTNNPSVGAAISIGDGSGLLASGSLDIVAPNGTTVGIGNSNLGAKYANIAVSAINIGTQAALTTYAAQLPSGLDFTQASLSALLDGSATLGTPAVALLTLTATQEVNILGSVSLNTGATSLVLNTPAIYGVGASTDQASITAAQFTWSGVAGLGNLNGSNKGIAISSLPGGQIAAGLAGNISGGLSITATGTPAVAATATTAGTAAVAGTITLGNGPQSQPNDQLQLDRLAVGFASVSLNATGEITANNQSALTVFAAQPNYGQPGTGGNLSLVAPLITTQPAAVLSLEARGALSFATPAGVAPAATAPVANLGGEITLAANSVAIATAVALPGGQFNATAQNNIDLASGGAIDLAGRTLQFGTNAVAVPAGTLSFASAAGNISLDTGSRIDVSAPAAAAGSVSFNALAGEVALNGALAGAAPASQTGGSFTVLAGTLATATQAADAAAGASAFDNINAALNAGGFTASRSFELGTDIGPSGAATTNIVIGNSTAGQALLAAHDISVTADLGSIDIAGTINASGTGPGTISLAAQQNLTLEAGALIDAHASQTASDSYGNPIAASNRAEVTLTSTDGALLLNGGTVNLSYPGAASANGGAQGQLVLNAPRVGTNDVAITARAPIDVIGAQSIALYAWRTYQVTDSNGTVAQNATGLPEASGQAILSLDSINADSTAYINATGANTALAGRLAGLAAYGADFHLRPGVEIVSDTLSGGNITVAGDVDLSGYRYNDAGYGLAQQTGVDGSGEPGALVFRASNDLIINGSITDGFAPPPDKTTTADELPADSGWVIYAPYAGPYTPPSGANSASGTATASDPLNADIYLPSTIAIPKAKGGVQVVSLELAAGTTFNETRDVSLNYAITIATASVAANTVIPFAAKLTTDSADFGVVTIPSGGFVTTASITTPSGTVIPAGTFLAGGTQIPPGSTFAAGSVFPVSVQVANNTVVPAGTPLSIFNDSNATLTLNANTAVLPVNAFLPSGTAPQFETSAGAIVQTLDLRPLGAEGAPATVQGYLYALSPLLPAGTQSFSLGFVSGADQASANVNTVLPTAVLNGGALAPQANTAGAAPGTTLIDDQHYVTNSFNVVEGGGFPNPAFSVIRTGTGNLSFAEGGNFDQTSFYGIYTAGTQSPLPGGAAANAPFDLAREPYVANNGLVESGITPGAATTPINMIDSSTYQANYPTDGGNLVLNTQGSATGDVYGGTTSPTSNGLLQNGLISSDGVGNWLWRQGGAGLGQSTAWWINFGTFVTPYAPGDQGYFGSPVTPQLVGFQGIGTLGGGNVTVSVGMNAGQTTDRSGAALTFDQSRGEGLVIAVGSTGRLSGNTLVETGGGSLTLTVGGTINPLDNLAYAAISTGPKLATGGSTLNGSLIDTRGDITVTAGAIGRLDESYATNTYLNNDPRPADVFSPILTPSGGITIVPGDGTVSIATQRDLVLDGVGDPGRVTEQNLTQVTAAEAGTNVNPGGETGFSLWTANTSVTLLSGGGNVTPVTAATVPAIVRGTVGGYLANDAFTDTHIIYPSQLYVTAATGDIEYGNGGGTALEVAPSANEQVAFLAGTSIQGGNFAIDLSGADPSGLSTIYHPAYYANVGSGVTDIRGNAGTTQSSLALFAETEDTPTVDYLSAKAAATPALFYANNGDIVGLLTGETITFNDAAASSNELAPETLLQWYIAAKPVDIIASGDIVNGGTSPQAAAGSVQQNQAPLGGASLATASGDLFLNNSSQSISVVSAGKDILGGYYYVGGPGLLEVDAGRNIQLIGYSVGSLSLLQYGSIKSLGSLITGAPISLTGGATISLNAGIGTGADYTAFADLYLNPANQANLALQITDPANKGKVQETYASQLLAYLQQNYGYTGTQADALSFFLNPANVPVVNQDAFLRGVFYNELLESGQQYNDPTSRFFHSYVRGRQAIGELFPGQNGATTTLGEPAGYNGAITFASGNVTLSSGTQLFDAGVATEHGGDIDVLDPGGQIVLGTNGSTSPGGGSGFVTNGNGNIDVFANSSVLLGKSRIFTNAGGNIQIWSATGDINAGIGARTTVVYNPPVISYDDAGGIVDSPAVPTSGAGIATNQPLPSVPIGNIDLTAPIGTIDAGEAGVRSSGNLNLAAARLANASGFSAGGKTTGNASAPSFSLGAAEAAGAAGGSSTASGASASANAQQTQLPSVIEVEVISVTCDNTRNGCKKPGV
jgi:filamentous hemagglutinin family protein